MTRKTRVWGTVLTLVLAGLLTLIFGVYLLIYATARFPSYGLFVVVLGGVLLIVAYPLGARLANNEQDKREMLEDWRKRNRSPRR